MTTWHAEWPIARGVTWWQKSIDCLLADTPHGDNRLWSMRLMDGPAELVCRIVAFKRKYSRDCKQLVMTAFALWRCMRNYRESANTPLVILDSKPDKPWSVTLTCLYWAGLERGRYLFQTALASDQFWDLFSSNKKACQIHPIQNSIISNNLALMPTISY